jgi:hypothetical protein
MLPTASCKSCFGVNVAMDAKGSPSVLFPVFSVVPLCLL